MCTFYRFRDTLYDLLRFLNGLSLCHIQGRKGSKEFSVFFETPCGLNN